MHIAVVSFTKEDEAHSLNVLKLDVAQDHVRNLMANGFTVFVKPHETYGDAIHWANAVYYKKEI